MNNIREAVRLVKTLKFNQTKAAQALGIGRSTLQEHLARFGRSGLGVDAFIAMNDEAARLALYPATVADKPANKTEPDMEALLVELAKPCVTAKILWEEYRRENPEGLGYTQFCERIKVATHKAPLSMRRLHVPGRAVYADYSGERPEIIDKATGEVRKAELLVMAWGFSNFTYAEAQESQKVGCWTMGHTRAFTYFGCVSYVVTPDCLKSGVVKAHRYDPTMNRTYVDMCSHYMVAAIPARPLEPTDKAKAENAVQNTQRRILASLRNRKFYSLAELNQAIRILLDELNDRPMDGYDGQTRRQLFEVYDKPAAQPLPVDPWEYCEWHIRRAGSDYCFEVDKHWYSVPYGHRGKSLQVQVTERTVQAYFDNERIATHVRSRARYSHTILEQHMPQSHVQSRPVEIEQLLWRARGIGPGMFALCEARICRSPHLIEGVRPVQGLLRHATELHDNSRADRAATYALAHGMTSCDSFRRILASRIAERVEEEDLGSVVHENIHGNVVCEGEA